MNGGQRMNAPLSATVRQTEWCARIARTLNPVPQARPGWREVAGGGHPAAVLVGLQWHDSAQPSAGSIAGDWHVIMTRRAGHLSHHAGQISFAGGKVDKTDASPVHTALREAQEEIDLRSQHVRVLGGLDVVSSPLGFIVQPVVAHVESGVSLTPAPAEVEEILHLPLALVLDRARHRRDHYFRDGKRRDVWVIDHPDYYLWGLSATILVDLAVRMEQVTPRHDDGPGPSRRP